MFSRTLKAIGWLWTPISPMMGVINLRQINFNQTAYRILLLLQWLTEKPLTMNEINERFQSVDEIGRAVSQDSLWLYINTLKALGCQISRPRPSNGFTYTLSFHPFSYFITSKETRFLKELLLTICDQLDHWDVVHYCGLVQRIFRNAPIRIATSWKPGSFRIAGLCLLFPSNGCSGC